MKLKILTIVTLLALIFTYIPVGAAAPSVTITSPEQNSSVSSEGVTLAATVSGADKVQFLLDDEIVTEFEGEGELSYTVETIEYAAHNFKVIAIKRGENIAEKDVNFTVRDYSETEVKNLDFNSFDGSTIGTSGFAGFGANPENGVPNGAIGLGEGPDGSGAFKFMVGKINATNLYLPFVNFSFPSTNKDVYVFEHDVMISDSGARLKYENDPRKYSIIENGKVGSYELQPGTWYKLKTEFDYQTGQYSIYVEGEKRDEGTNASLTKAEVRVEWANSQTVDGYLLIDNFKVTRKISTPIISHAEYYDGSQFVPFTTEVPAGTEKIRVYFDASLSAAGKKATVYEDGKAMSGVEFEINESDGYADITFSDSAVKEGSSYKILARAGGIERDLMYKFTCPKSGIGIMQFMFNAGSYQAKYQAQLTDGANVSTTVLVTNKTNEAKPVMAITVAYKNGEMTGIRAANVTAPANGPAFMNVPAVSADSDTEIVCYIVDGWEMRRPVMIAGELLKQ